MCVFPSLKRLSETFLILRRIQRDRSIIDFMYSTHFSCQILVEREFSREILEKHSDIKYHENRSIGIRGFPCGRTDRHDESNASFSHICEKRLTK